ncbi:O-antigen ligase family protein [Cellulophaga sp. E16_2]|uniref:O-antigen ligase family protein n=1 Tax=Cellulophaga sp. E16_2 TaxID=2789297 RepID=UPI001A91BBAF|nr:O-antigen ligase family protein [Cellulophaga sp. E16_2]MBO0591357.1 O-antigen ligase family protein [Cellulophaga sp. E16_2]
MKKNALIYLVLIGILFSVASTSQYLNSIKQKLTNDLVGLRFVYESDSLFDGSLLYTYDQKFSSLKTLRSSKLEENILFYKFPKSDSIVKKFRLDFGNNSNIKPIKIKALYLIFNNDEIHISENELFAKFYNISPSIKLNKKDNVINFRAEAVPFDPYIIFQPMIEFTINKWSYISILLTPFLIIVLIIFRIKKIKPDILDLFLILFILCIPLKIAWTTFFTLLLCIYGLYVTISKKQFFNKNKSSYFYLGLFFLLVLLGKPDNFSDIDMQFSLLFWAIISATLYLPKVKIYKYYSTFFILLNSIILVSGITFLLWFNDFYGLEIIDYYQNVKNYSRDIRGWLYYSHAAFLSFFGIVGVLFMDYLYRKKLVSMGVVILYHTLLISFIIITATRIGIIVYLVFLMNTLVKVDFKKRLAINSLIYIVFASFLFMNIQETDKSRSKLWAVTYEAIKDKPLFGHGIGNSNEVLHSKYYTDKIIGSPDVELNHSHNQFLTFFLEIGFLGSSIIFISFIYFLFKTKLYKNEQLIIFMFGLGYLFLTESALQTSKPLYVICFIFLIITVNDYQTKDNKITNKFKTP